MFLFGLFSISLSRSTFRLSLVCIMGKVRRQWRCSVARSLAPEIWDETKYAHFVSGVHGRRIEHKRCQQERENKYIHNFPFAPIRSRLSSQSTEETEQHTANSVRTETLGKVKGYTIGVGSEMRQNNIASFVVLVRRFLCPFADSCICQCYIRPYCVWAGAACSLFVQFWYIHTICIFYIFGVFGRRVTFPLHTCTQFWPFRGDCFAFLFVFVKCVRQNGSIGLYWRRSIILASAAGLIHAYFHFDWLLVFPIHRTS